LLNAVEGNNRKTLRGGAIKRYDFLRAYNEVSSSSGDRGWSFSYNFLISLGIGYFGDVSDNVSPRRLTLCIEPIDRSGSERGTREHCHSQSKMRLHDLLPGGLSHRHYPDDSQTGVNISAFRVSQEERRELRTATGTSGRYGVLAPFMGERLDRKLIESNWADVERVITALRNRVVVPSLILKKLGTTPRQSALSLAMREIGRIERTVHNLDWIEYKGLRADTTDVLNKGEARHTLSRAVAFHRLRRFRDRSHERQSHRAAALNLVTACIGLFNCRYLDRVVADLRRRGAVINEQRLRRLSPLGWDHINLTGDYVWSESSTYDANGLRPLNNGPQAQAA
jgi:hypothetical protein